MRIILANLHVKHVAGLRLRDGLPFCGGITRAIAPKLDLRLFRGILSGRRFRLRRRVPFGVAVARSVGIPVHAGHLPGLQRHSCGYCNSAAPPARM